jgi:hypothetical protein
MLDVFSEFLHLITTHVEVGKPTVAFRRSNPTKYYTSDKFAVLTDVAMISINVQSGDEWA